MVSVISHWNISTFFLWLHISACFLFNSLSNLPLLTSFYIYFHHSLLASNSWYTCHSSLPISSFFIYSFFSKNILHQVTNRPSSPFMFWTVNISSLAEAKTELSRYGLYTIKEMDQHTLQLVVLTLFIRELYGVLIWSIINRMWYLVMEVFMWVEFKTSVHLQLLLFTFTMTSN